MEWGSSLKFQVKLALSEKVNLPILFLVLP
jgi:hypothetical protein